jgi:hypothetical protein
MLRVNVPHLRTDWGQSVARLRLAGNQATGGLSNNFEWGLFLELPSELGN